VPERSEELVREGGERDEEIGQPTKDAGRAGKPQDRHFECKFFAIFVFDLFFCGNLC
jgi:hypothetical protein